MGKKRVSKKEYNARMLYAIAEALGVLGSRRLEDFENILEKRGNVSFGDDFFGVKLPLWYKGGVLCAETCYLKINGRNFVDSAIQKLRDEYEVEPVEERDI